MKSNHKFIKEYLKRITIGFVILFLLFIGALYLFFFIAHEVFWEKEDEVDQAVFSYLAAHVVNDGMTRFMVSFTHLASARILQISYGVLVLIFLLQKVWKRALEIAVIGLGGYAINYFMKISFQRYRPPHPLIERLENFSFPSGHATSAFIFYGLVAYLVWKTNLKKAYKYIISFVLVFIAFLVGFSRVYLRVHYASDVLAGFCIGFAWLVLIISLLEHLKKKSARELQKR